MQRSLFTDTDLEETVGLVRDGKEPVHVLVGQVTPQTVGRLFSVSNKLVLHNPFLYEYAINFMLNLHLPLHSLV